MDENGSCGPDFEAEDREMEQVAQRQISVRVQAYTVYCIQNGSLFRFYESIR